MSSTAPSLSLNAGQQRVVKAAIELLAQTRGQAQGQGALMHRSLRHLRLGPVVLAEMAAVVVVLTTLMALARPALLYAWDVVILWWAQRLQLPLALAANGTERMWMLSDPAASLVPGPATGVVTAAVVIAAFASTWWMSDRLTPIKYLVRTLCVVQVSGLLFFMFKPASFPYTVGGHLESMLDAGYYLMLSMPLLLSLGYGVLRLPLYQKFLHPLGVLAYFAVMLPHKALLHVLVLQHFSVLFMPMLYLCFGLVFDLMVFVALYSWMVSRTPTQAAV
ncbi:hypothetical protein [Ramlibacter sp.]|uniref:hypothetical protein n=1 Tax=Ramlibacter sp. TaxID=1917967 RepID=UPI0017E47A16|nr:hypothetical protein [Ramlibacter sp.]MBA2676655.1 hypothetical protein [Ramlibacter sp.]